MAPSREEVRRIAALARLDLTPVEEERFTRQLARVLDYFDQLRGVSAPAPATLAEPADGAGLPEAEDVVAPCLPQDTFLANAPESFAGFLVVPRVKAGPETP